MFRSAGVLEGGRSMPSELEGLLGERSISTSAHRSNQLDPATVEAAELILTMEGRHVQEIAIMQPDALTKSVPLLHAASLINYSDSIESLIDRLSARDVADYLSTEWDVDDPYKRGKRQYRKMVAQVDDLISSVIGPLEAAHLSA